MGVRRAGTAEVAAALWGLAEATFFFVVPDVWLSLLAARGRPWLRACLWATAGAVAGGLAMHAWAVADPAAALAAVERVPAVSPAMVERVAAQLHEHGPWALFVGPWTGTPYKLYAAQAGALGLPAWQLALVSVPARLARFVVLSWALGKLAGRLPAQWRARALLAGWAVFYAAFLALMPG